MELEIGSSSLFFFNKGNPWQIPDQCEVSAVPALGGYLKIRQISNFKKIY
jgi:hypothetical protein